jgi:branched-chain amino acid transport system ATP-binding protein
LLTLSDLHVFYADAHVLHGVSMTVGTAEAVCVMGPNGAGKSTLLKAIAGALSPRTGTIDLDGEQLHGRGPRRAVNAGVVLVPEGRHIFQSMTIRDNLLLGAHTRRDKVGVEQDVALMYELFPVLFEKRDALGKAISGGQQQMLAIARGLMSRPRVLLLDEPSLGLAPIVVGELPAVIGKIQATLDTAVLLVEQNASLALSVASRGIILETGRVQLAGSASELREAVERDGLFATTGADEFLHEDVR